MARFTLIVNDQRHIVDVSPDTPLLWVLRDVLGLKSVKYGCGMAQCGACTVHVNGNPVRSCVMPIAAVSGTRVTTIEGISPKHPVLRAWIEEDVPQCGYCQTGQIMGALALLERNPNPSDQEIAMAMVGHVCRCGTYLRIMRAIRRASRMLQKKE